MTMPSSKSSNTSRCPLGMRHLMSASEVIDGSLLRRPAKIQRAQNKSAEDPRFAVDPTSGSAERARAPSQHRSPARAAHRVQVLSAIGIERSDRGILIDVDESLDWNCAQVADLVGGTQDEADFGSRGRNPQATGAIERGPIEQVDRKSTRLNSSHITISYAVFCLKKKTT